MTRFIDKGRSRQVAQIGADREIRVFNSIKEASCITRVSLSSICLTCQGKQHQAGGYKWKYIDELTEEERTYVRETPERRTEMETR